MFYSYNKTVLQNNVIQYCFCKRGDILNRQKELFSCKAVMTIFALCFFARVTEYFLLRTEETIFGENFIHKIWGIGVVLLVLLITNWKWSDIGFRKRHLLRNFLMGLALAFSCFVIAYGIEMNLLMQDGKVPVMKIFSEGFSLNGYKLEKTELVFFMFCVLISFINVFMEEGIFRGIFMKLVPEKQGFWKGNLISAGLFGIWSLVIPIKNFLDGAVAWEATLGMVAIYYVIAFVMGLKWGMLCQLTGSVWCSMGDHLFYNVVVSQLIHVVTAAGIDELFLFRILTAQLLSFGMVSFLYYKTQQANAVTTIHTLSDKKICLGKSA